MSRTCLQSRLRPLRPLRPLRLEDERDALLAHAELSLEGFSYLLDLAPDQSWADHVHMHARRRRGLELPADRVPGAFLLAQVGPQVVGRVSVRFELNEFLATKGGHVGYAVRPGDRRNGYATEILRQALVVLRAEGVDRVLVTCDVDNSGSAAVITRNGGVEADPWVEGDIVLKRRFWIP